MTLLKGLNTPLMGFQVSAYRPKDVRHVILGAQLQGAVADGRLASHHAHALYQDYVQTGTVRDDLGALLAGALSRPVVHTEKRLSVQPPVAHPLLIPRQAQQIEAQPMTVGTMSTGNSEPRTPARTSADHVMSGSKSVSTGSTPPATPITLQSAVGYDWTKGAKPDKEKLEAMLREIVQLQYDGDAGKMTAHCVAATTYKGPDGRRISGYTLLMHYSHARWLADHVNEEGIGRSNTKKLTGYRANDSISYFLREILGYKVEVTSEYTLTSAEGYDWSLRAKPNKEKLEAMLREIVQLQFDGDASRMTANSVAISNYKGPDGKRIHGVKLLRHHSYARWLAEHIGEEDIRLTKAISSPGYYPHDSIVFFIRETTGFEQEAKSDYTLTSAVDYDWSIEAKPDKEKLEVMFREILRLQFSDNANKMKTSCIKATKYLGTDGSIIYGIRLLRHYSYARWLKDHPNIKDIGANQVCKSTGYRLGDSVNYLINHILEREDEEKSDYNLTTAVGYDWSKRAKPDKLILEAMLKEILQLQFDADVSEMTAHKVESTVYKDHDRRRIRGYTILNHYSYARWLDDHPNDKDIGQVKANKITGYRRSDSIAYFIREILGRKVEVISEYTLTSAVGYNWRMGAKPDKEKLEAMLKEIVQLQFDGDAGKMLANSVAKTDYTCPDGRRISGYTLLMHYSHARWLADHSDEAGIGRNKVNRLKGYLMSDSIAYFLREILGIPDFRTAKPEDIKKLIEELNIGDIIDLLIDAPSQLIEALAFLRPGYFKNVSVTEFVKAYIGLNVEQERQGTDRAGVDEWDKRRLYILAVIKAIEANDELDLSEAKFKQQVSLLMRLSRKSFEQNADQLLAELDTQAQEATHPFVKRLHEAVASHFRLIQSFEVTGMRTAPYAYQREGTRFLVSHQRAILADEAGLGKTFQATAAVQTLGLKRVLWITTASNKEAVRDDIMEHAEVGMDAIKIVISGDVAERKKQFAALNGERYIITNYETLVALKKTDPEAYAKLTEDLDVVIVDEAQLTDNVKTLRSSAVRDIPCNRRWLLSASPYQSNPERIWTLLNYLDPEKYPSRQAFKEMFTTTTGGLLLLHGELTDMMLRRTKQETMTHFTNPAESPFAEQLADGVPRLPKKIRVTPEVSGAYALAPEQADLIAWMIADYRGWINYFNENLPDGAERIESDAVNSLHKFQMIHKVIYEPEYFGLDCENPLYPALDQMVARHLAKDEKVILWCWNTELITTLQKRYAQFGVSRIDGSVMGEAREKARHEFQNDPHVRIMDANYLSGGVGLTLTAAHSAIFVQLPHVFPPLYQAEGRHHRLIGPHKIQFAKEHVFVEWMVPTYHAGFVDSIDDERLMEKLTHGTLVEQTRRRLEGGELLYNLVMEGYGDLEDLEEYFKLGVMEAMGLNDAEALDYVPQLPTKVRAYAKTARALLPLWKLVSGVAEARDQVLHLVDVLRFYPQLANQIGQAFEQAGVCHTSDLGYINALFEIRNKYVREQIIKRIPSLIINLYAQGVALTQTAKELDLDVKSPLAFLAQVCVVGHVGARAILQTAQELAHLRSSPSKRYIEEHFYVGVLAVLENDAVKSFLEAHSVLFEGAPLLERVHVLYRIGLLCRLQKATIGTFADKQYSSFKDMAKDIERAINQAIATFTSQPIESVEEMLVANPHWRGNADPILALFVGYQEFGNVALLNQAREVFSHVVDNDLTEWRMGENNREHGTSIDYLSDDEDFWNSYARPLQTTMPQFEVTTNRMNRALVRQYIALISEYEQDGVTVEGPWVQQELKAFRALVSPVDKERQIAHYQQELSVLGALLGRTEMNAEAMALIEKYNLQTNGTVLSKESLLLKVTELRNLLGWMLLDREFTAVNKGNEPDWQVINRQLEFKAKIYSRSKQAKTAEHYDALIDAVAMRAKGGQKFYDVDIVDTDDAATMTRMGALHPEMVNCFNSNGNPTFNQYVVTALASKNMRLVVVSARLQPGGPKQVVAAAMCKVKALEDDEPVLFLERGLYRLGYDFRNEMLAHLIMKKAQMEETSTQQLVVMDEVFGRAKDRDLHVHGIGAFTENEYVEPVFGLRRSGHINHLGRIANINPAQNHTVQQPLSQVVGTGMLGCSWEQYVAQLKAQSVTVVVDVRERPYMRNPKMQAYNRNQMAPALEKEGIEYIWLGDTLGNPKVNGARTLEGFREQHMKTQVYRQGKEQLLEIMRRAKGKVSLTCVESEASECHRTLIIEDL